MACLVFNVIKLGFFFYVIKLIELIKLNSLGLKFI